MANTFPFSDPVGVSKLTAQQIGLEAIDHRRGQGGLSQPMHGNTFGTMSGVFPGGTSGAGPSNDLAYTGATGLQLSFNAGHYGCDRGGGNLYLGMAYQGWNITLDDGDANNPRIDMVVIRNRDPGVDSGVTESARPTVLKGTPAASPSKPTGQLTNGDVPLWSFTVGGGSQYRSVLASEDERLFIVARGAIVPRRAGDNRPGAYEGQYRDNLETNSLDRWSGIEWQQMVSAAAWTAFTPRLFSQAGEVNLGDNGIARGRYQLAGKSLKVSYFFQAKSPCNMGYGSIYTRLPLNLLAAGSEGSDWHGRAQLNTQPPGGSYLQWLGDSGVYGGSNLVYPSFNKTLTDNTIAAYRAASSQGQAGTGIPQLAGQPTDPLRGLSINIELEVQ